MNIAIIGCGYVGLVTSAGLARLGHKVTCVDTDTAKVDLLRRGVSPIYEPNLCLDGLGFTTQLPEADFTFICVGTPQAKDGSCDISFVVNAVKNVRTGVVVIKSTVPVGTAASLRKITQLPIVSNPEFLQEGNAVHNFMHPNRIVIGGECGEAVGELYAGIDAPIIYTSNKSAELIKYASNCFLAMKLTFINEMAQFAEDNGADIGEIALGMGLDKRIGPDFLKVGPGYGGSCFPKDLAAMSHLSMVDATITVNAAHQRRMIEKIDAACNGLFGKKIACLGVTFKANTDDTRESPALKIINALKCYGAEVKIYDPKVANSLSLQETLADTNAAVVLTEWDEFKHIPNNWWPSVVVDLRNLYEKIDGVTYHSIGRQIQCPQRAEFAKQAMPATPSKDQKVLNAALAHKSTNKIRIVNAPFF